MPRASSVGRPRAAVRTSLRVPVSAYRLSPFLRPATSRSPIDPAPAGKDEALEAKAVPGWPPSPCGANNLASRARCELSYGASRDTSTITDQRTLVCGCRTGACAGNRTRSTALEGQRLNPSGRPRRAMVAGADLRLRRLGVALVCVTRNPRPATTRTHQPAHSPSRLRSRCSFQCRARPKACIDPR